MSQDGEGLRRMLIRDYFLLFHVDPEDFIAAHPELAQQLRAEGSQPQRETLQELASALMAMRHGSVKGEGTRGAALPEGLDGEEGPLFLFVLLCLAIYEQASVPLPRGFAEKFSSLHTSLGLSNIQLARALNIDSSLVSRWRSGERQIKEDNPLRESLARELERSILQAIPRPELGTLNLLKPEDPLKPAIRLWLFETRHEPGLEVLTENLLNQIQHVKLQPFEGIQSDEAEAPRLEALLQRIEANPYMAKQVKARQENGHPSHHYQGTEGLRSAVLNFLLEVLLAPAPQTLKLFSNQSMDWLSGDPDFSQAWLFLMQNILKQGHRIEIIHNFGRDEGELLEAVQHWLPLYLTGQITSYTLPSLGDTTEQSMVRTLFIREGGCAIHADFFRGMEEQTNYHWVTNRAALQDLEAQFDFLKSEATPLYQMVQGMDAIEARALELTEELLQAPDPTEVMILTQATLRPGLDPSILRRFLAQGKRVTLYIPEGAGDGALAPLVTALRSEALFSVKVIRSSEIRDLCLTVHKGVGIAVYHPDEAFLMEFRNPILARSFEAYLKSLEIRH